MAYLDQVIEKIKNYVQSIYEVESERFCYHDLQHVESVVDATIEMSNYYKLSSEDYFVVVAAAYFHDIGYIRGGKKDHEIRSANLAQEFLTKYNIDQTLITKIRNCILSTKMPQTPSNLLESILCDADLFHFGEVNFKEKSMLIHQELEATNDEKIGKGFWRKMTILLMQEHKYHTDYAENKLGQAKEANLNNLIKEEKRSKQKSESSKKPERGIETMFRITSANNQRLSDMADNKANILLTVNSIILSLVLTVLVRRLDYETHLLIPTIILMVIVVLTMIFAILSTIPRIPNGYFNIEHVEHKKINLLFFGNFFRMSYKDYEKGMNKAMDNSELLYSMLTRDVYSQGVSLGRKYVLLRYAYGIFMFGLIISVIAFSIAIISGK